MTLRSISIPARAVAAALLALVAVACGSEGPGPGPQPGNVRVTAISPTSGSTFGGTNVTITGEGFAAGATVQIGGVAATNVVVLNGSTMTATTAPRAAGVAEVRVTSGGKTGSLASAFTFVTPSIGTNAPPIINSLTVVGPRALQPATLANIADGMRLTASVSDTETPDAQLIYEWTATPSIGTFSGTGRSVEWLAPSSITSPQTVQLLLTVVERYQDADSQGLPVQREHRVQRTVSVRVHDGVKEIGDMAHAFMVAFSEQKGTTETLKDFSRTCDGGAGYQAELIDVQDNLAKYTITSYTLGQPAVTFAFASRPSCPKDGVHGDACAAVAVTWHDVEKSTGKVGGAQGTEYISAVYEDSRWLLCHAGFIGNSLLTGKRIIR